MFLFLFLALFWNVVDDHRIDGVRALSGSFDQHPSDTIDIVRRHQPFDSGTHSRTWEASRNVDTNPVSSDCIGELLRYCVSVTQHIVERGRARCLEPVCQSLRFYQKARTISPLGEAPQVQYTSLYGMEESCSV